MSGPKTRVIAVRKQNLSALSEKLLYFQGEKQ